MKTYRIKFSGRKAGALGITYNIVADRTAKDEVDAVLALYDEFEHIRVDSITELAP